MSHPIYFLSTDYSINSLINSNTFNAMSQNFQSLPVFRKQCSPLSHNIVASLKTDMFQSRKSLSRATIIPTTWIAIEYSYLYPVYTQNTTELHLSGLTVTTCHPDTQKIRITGFFFENKLHWQFEVRLLVFTVCTYSLNLSTMPYMKF